MNKMQKLIRKNNKGFSLVELIVVILIIGVLAVAIAPQVTQWVGRAGDNQAKNEKTNLISAAQVAAAEMEQDTANFDGTYDVSKTAVVTKKSTDADETYAETLTKILAGSELKTPRTIKISSDGAITVD